MKKFTLTIIAVLILCGSLAYATIAPKGNGATVESEDAVVYIMAGKTSTGAGNTFTAYPGKRTFHAKVVGTGAVTATVIIQVSNDGLLWVDATNSPHIALSGTGSDSDGFAMEAKWAYVRAYLDAVSGTGAAVTVIMGV